MAGRLAEIIGVAHRLETPIVHRDLKPANVLVQREENGQVSLRVTDFGIGSVTALGAIQESRRGTTPGGVLGSSLRGSHTPLYASPQQIRGDPPNVRDDVHALGVIWYQMLTGDLGSGAPTGLWAEEMEEAGIGRDLIRLLGACVSGKLKRRPADAAVLGEQLQSLLKPGNPMEPAPPVPPAPVADPLAGPVQELIRSLEAANSSWLLDLTNKGIGDAGLKALAAVPGLANRSAIYLSGNNIGDEGLRALVASPYVANLDRLILWDNQIGDEGVKALAASSHLAALSTLDLGRNRVGDSGVAALASSPHLANLRALILVSNNIGDEGALALARSPFLKNLAELKPLNNHISAAGVTALRERFGKRVRIY